MRRHLPRLILCLVLGLFTAVAVALAIAALSPVPMYPRNTTGAFVRWDRPWHASEAHRFGLVHIWWSEFTSDEAVAVFFGAEPLPAGEIVQLQREESRERQASGRTRDPLTIRNSPHPWGTLAAASPPPAPITMGADAGFGWPAPCLWYQILTTFNPATVSTVTNELRGGLLLAGMPGSLSDGYRALPLRPVWGGLILNTAFYALLWVAILFTPPAVRRRIRRRRGHCPACGYDVENTYTRPCPECGETAGAAP